MADFNTDKNVYILGAGFSKEIGLPLQDDFLLIAKEVYFKDTTMFDHFNTVFEYQNKLARMRQFLNYPLLNLEQLFNLIEMDIFYSKDPEKEKIKDNFIKLICDVLIDKTPCPFKHDSEGHLRTDDSFSKYLPFIGLFIKNDIPNLEVRDDTIISLNYDLVVEGAACIYNWQKEERKYFRESGLIQFNTMFGKGNISVDGVDRYFLKNRPNSYFPPMALFSEGKNAIKLIKLHGSINWKTGSDGKTFIVPPTWNKSDPEVRRLWEIAYEEIKTAKRIIFIGYSFPETDIYIKSLLALALNENRIIQNIFFVNPDKDVAKKACLSLLDKHFEKYCKYKEWKYSELINTLDGQTFIHDHLNRIIIP
jgi:hypothetical protein